VLSKTDLALASRYASLVADKKTEAQYLHAYHCRARENRRGAVADYGITRALVE